jgi:hypothetical protein
MGLAAQGYEDRIGAFASKLRPMVIQVLVNGALMKADFVFRPACVPEFVFHGGPPEFERFPQSNLICLLVESGDKYESHFSGRRNTG